MEELEKLKEKFDKSQKRNLLCKFEKSFFITGSIGNDRFLQVELRVVSEEADFVLEQSSSYDTFEQSSRDNVCYVKSDYFQRFMEEDYSDASYQDKEIPKEDIDEYLSDKLIIIRPFYFYNQNRKCFYKNGATEDVIKVNPLPRDSFISIPVLPNKEIYDDFKKGNIFPLLDVSPEIMGIPEYICYDKRIFKVELVPNNSIDSTWRVKDTDSVIELELDYEELIDNYSVIEDTNNYIFISKNKLMMLKQIKLSEKEEEISTDSQDYEPSKQEQVCLQFLEYTKSKGLCYSLNDIRNFYTCVVSRQLVILAGMSGTGKTRLPLKFAEYFNMNSENNTLLFLPVSPSFTEPSDILGFLNPNTGIYSSSETGLVEFLRHAEKNNDKMHMVIFDEMNLAQIEFWFAPFMSILEKDIAEREIQLYSGESQRCLNKEQFPPKIKLGKNIIFIGTINLDETTKNISDRLLDRSFIINLRKETFTNYQLQQSSLPSTLQPVSNSNEDFIEMPYEDLFEAKYIDTFKGPNRTRALEFFDKIHEVLNETDSQKGISFRSVKNIAVYLKNKPAEMNDKLAFDYAFKQTIMKKINGSIDSIGDFLGNLNESKLPEGKLIDIFNEYKDLSEFTECRAEVKNKLIELEKYGYAR